MKCFVVFVLVALAAVAMAQDSSFTQESGTVDLERAPESGGVKRDRRGFLATSYSGPAYYGGGHNAYSAGYNTHYNAPYAYYRSYPHYGYGSYY